MTSAIDPALILRFTGQREVMTVEAAAAKLLPISAAVQRARANSFEMKRRVRNARTHARLADMAIAILDIPKKLRVEAWIVLLVIASVAAIAGGLALGSLIQTGVGAVVAAVLIPFAIAFGTLPLFSGSTAARLKNFTAVAGRQYQLSLLDVRATQDALAEIERRYSAASQIYQGLIAARDYPLNRLLNTDFRSMAGFEFEAYLAELFRFRGYDVRSTGRSGDQGVDLIISRGGVSIAVQAKCYAKPVSNSAVQEVYTGMRIYSCNQCAVVTSCSFTKGAIQAAQAVGCTLVSGSDIYLLIRGQMTL